MFLKNSLKHCSDQFTHRQGNQQSPEGATDRESSHKMPTDLALEAFQVKQTMRFLARFFTLFGSFLVRFDRFLESLWLFCHCFGCYFELICILFVSVARFSRQMELQGLRQGAAIKLQASVRGMLVRG